MTKCDRGVSTASYRHFALLNNSAEEFDDDSYLTVPSVFSQHTTHLSVPNLTTTNVTYAAPFSHDLMAVTGDEMEALFEREKFAYMEKSKNLQDQLETLKSDIEDLKRDDKITELDKIHR